MLIELQSWLDDKESVPTRVVGSSCRGVAILFADRSRGGANMLKGREGRWDGGSGGGWLVDLLWTGQIDSKRTL